MTDQTSLATPMRALIAGRYSRRGFLAGSVGAVASMPLLSLAGCATASGSSRSAHLPAFEAVAATNADTVTVPPGFRVQTLVAWGDPLFAGQGPFDPDALSRFDQEARFGMNNDMLALFPAEYAFPTPLNQDRYFLCVNHEYAGAEMMFPTSLAGLAAITPAQFAALLASMGCSVLEITRSGVGGAWQVVRAPADDSRNRRITPFSPVIFEGPAASHRWVERAALQFNANEPFGPEGSVRCGTMANCAGGQTPWGTYLTSEENFNFYFHNSGGDDAELRFAREEAAYQRDCASFQTPLTQESRRPAPPQFDMAGNPYGPVLYGWTVEIDPYDPDWTPRKRTALGRRKGECATTALTRDGRVAVYSGDDQVNEFVYKFVSSGRFDPRDRTANRDLLNDGALYAARFEADGTGRWLALTVEAANAAVAAAGLPESVRFRDLGDVVVRARDAARLMGATPMDRPEDVEAILDANWVGQGPVLVVCTNNRTNAGERPGNPRREGGEDPSSQPNLAGHIVRIDEAGGDCGSLTFTWDIFAMAGDPDAATALGETRSGDPVNVSVALAGAPTFAGDRFACPDNVFFDRRGHVWIATDSSDGVFADCNDMVLVAPTADGDGPRPVKRFLVGPVGAEICGPLLTPDETAFFCAIQHPGEGDVSGQDYSRVRWRGEGARPGSSFPDGDGAWPRSAVVIVSREDGGPITS
jgi:secreted PhoX family phosphatase